MQGPSQARRMPPLSHSEHLGWRVGKTHKGEEWGANNPGQVQAALL